MKRPKTLLLPLLALAAAFYLLISQQISLKETIENNSHSHDVTIVTAYFKLDKSKHSLSKYETWIKNFLPKVETPMIIFTDNNTAPLLRELRGDKPAVFITFSSLWEAEPNIHFRKAFERSHEIDPEQRIHNLDLYAIWNMKPWMLGEAARYNHFKSKYFVYTDMGAFRQHDHVSLFRHWPDTKVLDRVFSSPNSSAPFHNAVLFGICRPPWKREDLLCHNSGTKEAGAIFIQGGTLTCTVHSCSVFSERYYRHILALRISRDWFIGSDQKCFQQYVATYPLDSLLIDTRIIEPSCGDRWFYYQQWLAKGEERVQGCTRTELNNALALW